MVNDRNIKIEPNHNIQKGTVIIYIFTIKFRSFKVTISNLRKSPSSLPTVTLL